MVNKITAFETKNKYLKKYNNKFKNFDIEKKNIDELIESSKKKFNNIKLLREYALFNYLYENGGLVIYGNFEFINSINSFFENDFFIAFHDDKEIATNIIYAKEKENKTIKKILDLILSNEYENITDILSKVTDKNLHENFNYVIRFDENSYIYPYDFFYPIDYENKKKRITSNVKAIFIDSNKKSNIMQKRKIHLLKKIGPTACEYLFDRKVAIRNNIGYKKYITVQRIKNKLSVKEDVGIKETFLALDKLIDKKDNVPYIIFHNPNWLVVTAATKELFTNCIPVQEVFLDKNVNKIVDKIIKINPQQVIFSAFDYGWDKIAIKIRKTNPNIKLKSFWHGSNSQVIDKMNWDTNLMVINLHKQGIIDVMGTCKKSLLNFYESQGYKAAFIMNTVRLNDDIKSKLSKINKENNGKINFGLYSASSNWRKNTYNQVMAVSSFKNAELEVVPLKYELKRLAYFNELDIVGSEKHLKREDLLAHIAKRDIVMYVTFSECAPMLPIEALEAGTICIMGNNHHYFQGEKLHDYLVVEREDDVEAIKEKIRIALENKDEIFKLYKQWKINNDKQSAQSVIDFLNM